MVVSEWLSAWTLAAKPDNLGLIPGTREVEQEENRLHVSSVSK